MGGGIVDYLWPFRDAAEGKALAAVRRQEKECRQLLYRGKSADCRVSAGQKFSITGHLYGDVELLPSVTRVTCKSADLTAEGSAHYEVAFVAIDGNMTFRPERVTPRPHIKGMLTGIIDAAGPGQYAEVDDMGRYKVRFMFDTSGPDGGKASRPVRMMQPHAGGGYGMHFPLRGGVEVLITFIDGDPDRPIIAGTVPNPQTPSPVSAANARRNVLRTGAGNEMNIDDTVGSERIKFTVPHGNTVFQLGAPNLAESGAALATTGAFTATATAGTSMVGGFHAGLSAISSWFGSGNIVSEASKMSIGTFLLSGGQALSALASAAAAAIAGYKGALEFSEKRALRNGVAAQDKATKKWQSCDACTKDLEQRRAGLPPELQVTAIALEEQQKAANAAYADSLDTRRKRDQSREASVGLWTDQNEVAHTRRAARLDEQYQQERGQAQSALSAARRAQDTFATTLADAARDPNLSLEQQRAIMEYRDALGACGNDCDGLAADQVNADKELKKYHDMRADHSDEHAWIQSAEKTVGATAAVVGATTQLMSTILALASLAKKKEAQIKLTSRWARLSGNLRKSDNASRASISVSPSTPLHAVGATGSATLFGKDVAIEGDMVGIYASGTKGHVAVNGKKKATLSAKDRTEVSSTDVTFVQGQEVKLQGWDGRSKGPFFVINPDNTGNRFMLKNRDWTLSGDDKAVKLGKSGAWEIKLDDKGIDAGKKDAGEIDLSATKAVVKKKSTQLTLEDEKGVLKSKVCHIEGQNTKCKVSESQITLDAQGRINLEAKKVDVKAKSIALNGAKVDLG
ncbi:MAG: type VI secretion system tip protein VgrG [Myxococcota bacterium]